MTNGYLSQTIQNIITNKNHLTNVVGLPDKAAKIRNEAVGLIEKNSSFIAEIQVDLLSDATRILNTLQNASRIVEEQWLQALEAINNAHDLAVVSKNNLELALQYNHRVKTNLLNLVQELQNILRELQNRHSRLLVDEQKMKDKAHKFKKERFYFLALGPFGLAGLATATALFVKWNTKAQNTKKEITQIRSQMNALELFQDHVSTLQDTFSFGIEAMSN